MKRPKFSHEIMRDDGLHVYYRKPNGGLIRFRVPGRKPK